MSLNYANLQCKSFNATLTNLLALGMTISLAVVVSLTLGLSSPACTKSLHQSVKTQSISKRRGIHLQAQKSNKGALVAFHLYKLLITATEYSCRNCQPSEQEPCSRESGLNNILEQLMGGGGGGEFKSSAYGHLPGSTAQDASSHCR